jgi:CRP-like cAMP-binding protein
MNPKPFDIDGFLAMVGAQRTVTRFSRKQVLFSQGDRADAVFYIETGGVKLTAFSKDGREATVAILGPGAFFGEACLTSHCDRTY